MIGIRGCSERFNLVGATTNLARSKKSIILIAFIFASNLLSANLYAKPEYRGPGRYYTEGVDLSKSHSHNEDLIEYARVVKVRPLTRIVRVSTPKTECWQEKVLLQDRSSSSATGAILGGIIGAAVGNELGHYKSNKKVGAVAGALLGSSIGNDLSKQNRSISNTTRYGYEERCRSFDTYHEEERIDGYLVEYQYRGHKYTTRTDTDPGDKIKVRVSVSPLI